MVRMQGNPAAMDNKICYLNTDLDLVCRDDLTELAEAFDVAGASPVFLTRGEDATWYATIETDEQHAEPEPNIAQLLAIVESLTEPLRSVWLGCTRREFNIGYDCGADPWAFQQSLSPDLLARIASADASLRITLYPDREGGTAQESEP